MASDLLAYGGLFLTALIAGSIFPLQSEAALVGLLLTEKFSVALLIAAATIGNVLGSCLNWMLGRAIETFKDRRWFPANARTLARAQGWYRTYGRWTLLLSWMPVVGDPLTIVAGTLKEPLGTFVLLVCIAKLGRYLAVAFITLNWL